jgi:hypothetical protein
MDPIALRGFAQTFKTSPLLLQSRALGQRDREFQAEQQQAKRKQDTEWLDRNSKLDFKEVSFELQKPLSDKFVSTKKQMDAISKKGLMGDLSTADMLTIQQLKNDFDADNALASSFDKDLKDVNEVLKADKDGLYKRGDVAGRLSDMTKSLWTRDEYGDFKVNRDINSPKTILSDPDMMDEVVMGKQFFSEFSDKVNETISSPGYQTLQTEYKFKGNLFEVDKDGNPILNPNTGKYIPKRSPENIALFDSNEGRKIKLDRLSQSITKEGENWENNRAKAFEKFFIEPHAQVSKKVQVSNKPEHVISKGEKQSRVNSRFNTLQDIVYNKSQGSLSQSFNVSDNIRVEFASSGQGTDQGPGIDQIKIFKREKVGTDKLDAIMNKLNGSPNDEASQAYEWKEYDPGNPIWLKGDEGKEAAIFKLNEILNEAQPDNMSISQEDIRDLFGKKKPAAKKTESKPKTGAFNDF